jgi:hypothetical protein
MRQLPCMQAWLVPYSQLELDARQSPLALAPRVHCGFFASWHCNSLNQQVIGYVRQLMDSRKTANLAEMRVVVTGAGSHMTTGRCGAVGRGLAPSDVYGPCFRATADISGSLCSLTGVCTGHSLGGALATLAAHDLQLEFGFGSNLHCYTFGAPRTGNHAFAAESSRLVPETWHVINDRAPSPPYCLRSVCGSPACVLGPVSFSSLTFCE